MVGMSVTVEHMAFDVDESFLWDREFSAKKREGNHRSGNGGGNGASSGNSNSYDGGSGMVGKG